MRVYIEKKKLKVKEVKVLKIDENGNIEIKNKFLNSLKKRIKWMKSLLKIRLCYNKWLIFDEK